MATTISRNDEDAESQLELLDENAPSKDPDEVDIPKRRKRCIGNPTWFGVATVVVLVVGLGGMATFRRDHDKIDMVEVPDKSSSSSSSFDDDDQTGDPPSIYEGVNVAEFPIPRGDLPGWVKYHKKLKAKAEKDGGDARVVLLGDSITEEFLGTGGGNAKKNWGSTEMWEKYYGEYDSLNLGLSGDQTQHLLWRLQNGELPDMLQPESILVAIGTNNLGAGMSANDTVGGIEAVVKYVREVRPDALVCVTALFPRANREAKHDPTPWDAINEVNRLVKPLILQGDDADKIRFMDCNDRFLTTDDEGKTKLNHELILSDNLHLTAAGLEAWSVCVADAIRSGLTN